MRKNDRNADGSIAGIRGPRIGGSLLLLCLIAGCTKPEAYYEVFREQRAAYRDVIAILAEINDEKSMGEAKAKLQDQFEKLDGAARKAAALPKPPAELEERLRDESLALQRAINDMREQIGRVQKLPGGKAFFKQFESSHSGLFHAVQP